MYANQLFAEKIILVSGGRSGIGYAIAEAFLHYGAKVFIASRKEEALKEAAQKLNKKGDCFLLLVILENQRRLLPLPNS